MRLKKFVAIVAAVARTQGLDPSHVEVWFGDEARVRQKNKITRRWAMCGARPSAPHDQRTASTYIFSAICPGEGKAAGLVLPWCNFEAMNLRLAEISTRVAPGRQAVLVVDQAGWHLPASLNVPSNIAIVPLPAKCPELTPRKVSGSSYATTGSPTECSPATTISSIIAATPGTSSSSSLGRSSQLDRGLGLRGSDR